MAQQYFETSDRPYALSYSSWGIPHYSSSLVLEANFKSGKTP